MKFSRSSSKTAEAATASEFPSFFHSKNKNMEAAETTTTTQPKNSRLFSRKKKEENDFDMLKTVGGEDDARNEKSARNIFRRKSKADKGDTTEADGTKSATAIAAVPAIFAFPNTASSAEKEVREESSSRSIFRSRSKEQADSSMTKEKVKEVAEAPVVADSTTSTKNTPKLFSKGERTQIKAVVHTFSSDTDSIKVEKEETAPVLAAPNHVLIKVQASTVTLNDCLLRRGFDFDVLTPVNLPLTPGYDIVGNIVEVGSNVSDFAVGERVAAIVRCGGNARWISVPASSLVKVPESLDSAEVAALVSIYTTAYQSLRKITGSGPMFSLQGKKVLILGGMDGVGQALIQLCKKARATIYVSAPKLRHVYLNSVLGVTPLHENDWLSGIEGQIDYVFDGICENGTEKSIKALKSDGEIVCYGHASMLKEKEMGILGVPLNIRMNQFYTKFSSRVHTVDIWDNFVADPTVYKQDLTTLCQLLKWNKLKPHIAKRVALTEVAAAQAKLEQGDIRGTIVCFPWRPIVRTGKITTETDE